MLPGNHKLCPIIDYLSSVSIPCVSDYGRLKQSTVAHRQLCPTMDTSAFSCEASTTVIQALKPGGGLDVDIIKPLYTIDLSCCSIQLALVVSIIIDTTKTGEFCVINETYSCHFSFSAADDNFNVCLLCILSNHYTPDVRFIFSLWFMSCVVLVFESVGLSVSVCLSASEQHY